MSFDLRDFALAGGSVLGAEHARIGRNNQDALAWWRGDEGMVAVVCDGCGSGAHSELGARLGARLVVEALRRRLADRLCLAELHAELLTRLGDVAAAMGGDLATTVRDHLLFTIVGAVVTPAEACLFHLGDGFLALNGEALPIPRYAGDAPPYLGYGLLGQQVAFETARALPTAELDTLLIGSDGVGDVPDPGPAEFWRDAGYFTNPDRVRRRLSLLQRAGKQLPDDTTLISVRRRYAS